MQLHFFLHFFHSCKVSDGPEEFITTKQYGSETFTYYLSLIFIVIIISDSHLGKGSYIRTLSLSFIGGIITLFINWIGEAGFGRPCGHSPTQFQNLLYLAHLLIITSCFINIFNKQEKIQK